MRSFLHLIALPFTLLPDLTEFGLCLFHFNVSMFFNNLPGTYLSKFVIFQMSCLKEQLCSFLLPDDSSTLTSSSDEDTFSHSETSLSDDEMLVHMSYPHHHRALLTRKRNSAQVDMATVSKQLSAGERATLRSDGFMELWEDADALRALAEVQGVTIRNCRMNNGKGGVMVSCQGHAKVIGCHIANMGYGIRCVQNSRVSFMK